MTTDCPPEPPPTGAEDSAHLKLTRRDLFKLAGSSVAMSVVPMTGRASMDDEEVRVHMSSVTLTVNGVVHHVTIDTRTTLLDLLREHLHMNGTKKGCDHGQCGACTVLLDGRRINACLTLGVMHGGSHVTTIEGLGAPNKLHPLQAAFIKHDAFQCGYCTPGQICSAVAMLDELRLGVPSHVTEDLDVATAVTSAEIRERMSGNICRCGAYSNIIEAISEVAKRSA